MGDLNKNTTLGDRVLSEGAVTHSPCPLPGGERIQYKLDQWCLTSELVEDYSSDEESDG